jgi:hypothetical protein
MSILKTIDNDIKLCEMWAHYWMTMADTGLAAKRKLYHGTEGPEFTDEEKIQEAMDTALRHLHSMRELVDLKKELLSKDPEGSYYNG